MKYFTLFFIFFIGSICYAQNCIVLDKDSEFSIQYVQVINEDNSKKAISNENGIIDSVYYGKDSGSHLPFDRVKAFASR